MQGRPVGRTERDLRVKKAGLLYENRGRFIAVVADGENGGEKSYLPTRFPMGTGGV